MFWFLVWHALLVAVSCELFGPQLGYTVEYAPNYNDYKPRDYQFSYAVSDPHTGDHKSQWEVKENGIVRGGYSLLEPDGTTRIVEYIADDGGFRAAVKKLGTAVHPVPIAPIPAEPVPITPLVPEVNYYKTYDGQVTNYADLNTQPPILYKIDQDLGGQVGVLSRPEEVQILQRPQISEVPLQVPLAQGTVQESPGYIRKSASLLGDTSSRVETIPLVPTRQYGEVSLEQIQANIGRIEPDLETIFSAQRQNVDNFRQSLSQVEASLGRIEAVPAAPLQNGRTVEVEAVPQGQRLDLGNGEYTIGANLGSEREVVPLPNIYGNGEGINSGQSLQHINDNLGRIDSTSRSQVPELVPVGPSYRTVIEYQDLTGNPQDGSSYSNDQYRGSYSQKVRNLVPLPVSRTDVKRDSKKQFLIYYPESETH